MRAIYLSVVAPFYNEVESIGRFCAELRLVCDGLAVSYEVVLVDDGSSDGSMEVLRGLDWPNCRVIRLAANAGHQNALDAGLRHTQGTWVVSMDSDLQHPPELIGTLLHVARTSDVEVVHAVREDRATDGLFKRSTARAYYLLMRRLSGVNVVPHSADFRIMSGSLVAVLNSIPEEKVFRLLIPSLGFPSAQVLYRASPRYAGKTKYSLARMVSLASLSAVSFSPSLLRWVSGLGVITAVGSFAWLLFVVGNYFLGRTISGWASVMGVVLLLGGCQLLAVGLIGEYVSAIHMAIKGRPHFVVRSVESLSPASSVSKRAQGEVVENERI